MTTRTPRRSEFWVSIDRSWTCRNASTRIWASPVSLATNSRTRIQYAMPAVTTISTVAIMRNVEMSDTVVRRPSAEPGVDGPLDQDRHDRAAERAEHRQQDREPDAVLDRRVTSTARGG